MKTAYSLFAIRYSHYFPLSFLRGGGGVGRVEHILSKNGKFVEGVGVEVGIDKIAVGEDLRWKEISLDSGSLVFSGFVISPALA